MLYSKRMESKKVAFSIVLVIKLVFFIEVHFFDVALNRSPLRLSWKTVTQNYCSLEMQIILLNDKQFQYFSAFFVHI